MPTIDIADKTTLDATKAKVDTIDGNVLNVKNKVDGLESMFAELGGKTDEIKTAVESGGGGFALSGIDKGVGNGTTVLFASNPVTSTGVDEDLQYMTLLSDNDTLYACVTTQSGQRGVYKYNDDGTWTILPNPQTTPTCFCIYKNQLHCLGGGTTSNPSTLHQKYNGSSWVSASTMSKGMYRGFVAVLSDGIHAFSADSSSTLTHYRWNGSSWKSMSTPSFAVQANYTSIAVLNDEIYFINAGSSGTEAYKWNKTSWSDIPRPPSGFYQYSDSIAYNGGILRYCPSSVSGVGNVMGRRYYLPSKEKWYDLGYSETNYNTNVHLIGRKTAVYKDRIIRVAFVTSTTRGIIEDVTPFVEWKTYLPEGVKLCADNVEPVSDNLVSVPGGVKCVQQGEVFIKFPYGISEGEYAWST